MSGRFHPRTNVRRAAANLFSEEVTKKIDRSLTPTPELVRNQIPVETEEYVPPKPELRRNQILVEAEEYVPPTPRIYIHAFTNFEKDIFDEFDPVKPVINEPIQNAHYVTSKTPVRKCADCKKPPHMQCLHCSKYVCMECAQKHVALATQQIDVAQQVLNDKMGILDRLAATAKEHVNADRNRIIKQADVERDQVFVQIDQIVEQQKKQIRDKNAQLSELALDEIPSFIQLMTSEMEYLTESNNQLFRINSTLPKIQIQQGLNTRK